MIWHDMIYDMIYDMPYMIWYMIWYKIWYMICHMIWYIWYDIWWYMIYDTIRYDMMYDMIRYDIWYMIYLLTAIGLTPGGSSTVYIYTQTIHRTTQSTQTIHRKTQFTNLEECGPCPVFASYTLAFTLQLRKKHGKTSGRVAEVCMKPDKGIALRSDIHTTVWKTTN